MIDLAYAEVNWELNAYCKFQCAYCDSGYRNGTLDQSVEQYLSVIEKLQVTRYQHHSKILWKLGGGEPLHFPHLGAVLRKIKERDCVVRLDTSGDDTWFSYYAIAHLVDQVKLTYHSWQNDDVFGFILEQCEEKNTAVSIVIPLEPGYIVQARERVKHFKDLGYNCNEKLLYDRGGNVYPGYSRIDLNRIHGHPDDHEFEIVPPVYQDLSIVTDTSPIYTGSPCYAGVDWIHINPRGFASYSQCGGRNEHYNVFDPAWTPPSQSFPCSVNQCRSEQDRTRIRIVPV
jgi:organic radical activating enzyme